MTESRKPLRILINGMHAKSGGGLTYLRSILPHLAADTDLELHLFINRAQYDLLAPLDHRIRIHLFDISERAARLLLWEQLAMPVLANVMDADVTFSPANYGPLAAPGRVIMLRNSLAVAGRETRLLKRLYWMALFLMTAVSLITSRRAIAVSEYAKRTLTFGLGRSKTDRVAIIHHGVSPFFMPPPAGTQRKEFLLAVGDVYIQKNFHTLLFAFAGLRETFPDTSLKIAGGVIDEGYYAELMRLVRAQGLEDHVQFLGSVDRDALRSLYQECRAFVFPSTVETFGNPLIEAMACGAPIACSNMAAMPEVVGDAAVFFDPVDEQDIRRALTELLNNEGKRRDLMKRGMVRASAFSWENSARSTAKLLKAAAGT
jgi:glycosyltransferase involved in cell wall biosynthesis